MSSLYYNHHQTFAESVWERSTFATHWWSMFAGDRRWVPPFYPRFRRELEPGWNEHLSRMRPVLAYMEAINRPLDSKQRLNGGFSQDIFFGSPLYDIPVAVGAGLADPRRPGFAYLGLLNWANDLPSLDRFVERLAEEMSKVGCRRLVAPTGLSFYLGSGLLKDHWTDDPPVNTPYNAPYLPDLAASVFKEAGEYHLYHLTPGQPEVFAGPDANENQVEIVPLRPERLAGDLLELFATVLSEEWAAPPPDQVEAAFLLRWLCDGPVWGWLALAGGEPAGFILQQPDYALALRRWKGGRRWFDRPFLDAALRRSGRPGTVRRGRLVFGGVLSRMRGRGLGRRLLAQALRTAQAQGWESLSIGPLPARGESAAFLVRAGAQPRQSYAIYELEI